MTTRTIRKEVNKMTTLELELIALLVFIFVGLLMYVLFRQYDRILELEKETKLLRRDVEGNAKIITEVISYCTSC